MLKRLRDRVQGRQEGFTLIELLVVILIIGILAAVAIPTFLSQTTKAYDSNVQASLNSAQTAMETYYTNNQTYPNGLAASATTAAANPLIAIEGTLASPWGANSMTESLVGGANGTTYTLVAEDTKANPVVYFDLTYNRLTGAFTKTCNSTATATQAAAGNVKNEGSCSNGGTW